MKVNYQKKLEDILGILRPESACGAETGSYRASAPSLLLHSCCAPCSSYVLEYLSSYFSITVLYFNPNIYPEEEYVRRLEEQKRFISRFPARHKINIMEGTYNPSNFYTAAAGLEDEKEGGLRCFRCYELRLAETSHIAARENFHWFSTTLSVSPWKNAEKINVLGSALSESCGVPFLYADFKKKNGYKRSIELSAEYRLYRQDYCGCRFSLEEKTFRGEKNLPAQV